MSIEDELQRLALERENAFESALDELDLDPPDFLLRQMRAYLAEQEDHARIEHFAEKSVQLRHRRMVFRNWSASRSSSLLDRASISTSG